MQSNSFLQFLNCIVTFHAKCNKVFVVVIPRHVFWFVNAMVNVESRFRIEAVSTGEIVSFKYLQAFSLPSWIF